MAGETPRGRSRLLALTAACLALSGCMAWQTPANPGDLEANGYMAERRPMPAEPRETVRDAMAWNLSRCDVPERAVGGSRIDATDAPVLSPGDLLRITAPGNEAPSGMYEVGNDGVIALEGIGPLRVVGLTQREAEALLNRRLVAAGWFRAQHARVALSLLERGPLRVVVAGAVFQPGRVIINQRAAQETDTARQNAIGAHALGSTLSTAITFAGGVRPDADIGRVELRRGGQLSVLDLTGIVTGDPVNDVMLVDGDRVSVPSRRCFQAELARPTPITPPGVRAYISNLSVPANNNAGAAIGRDATNFPYGIRLLQALASVNCIGGAQMTNADRWAVLISVNPLDGQTEVIERRIEALVRRSDRDAYNPVIMPNDAIACYDSRVTNGRELVRTLSDVVLSVGLGIAIAR
jgi:protein involved in polysaccharide export with SLBB domain